MATQDENTVESDIDHIETAISIVEGATGGRPSEFAINMMRDRAAGGPRYSREERAQIYAVNAMKETQKKNQDA